MACSDKACLFEGRYELFVHALHRSRGFYVRIDTYSMCESETTQLKRRAMEMLDMLGEPYDFTEQGARMRWKVT